MISCETLRYVFVDMPLYVVKHATAHCVLGVQCMSNVRGTDFWLVMCKMYIQYFRINNLLKNWDFFLNSVIRTIR
jgi:hypothetical protein